MGDGRDMEHGIRLRQRVVTGVVSEGTFHPQGFDRIHIPLDDEVGIGRNLEVVGLALDQFDGLFAQIPRQQKFIQAIGQRGCGGEGEHGIATEKDGDGHALTGLVITTAMTRSDLLQLPVHTGRPVVINLDPVHA